ncbi:phage-related putative endonuclease [Bordetella bronchiseptica RB50]|uniref:Phage-related putative endonuclease n=1 Tax=Bordetella bronchiseptica (strain ATCC BAA-588 / NCTC 13252 / RB50) TaxID=257310 RepID=A0A0H3LTJ9_BORBR|nr:phage-related putative endonuclease [Bordetella bronchiseptica RB50]
MCQCDDCKTKLMPLVAHEVDHIDNRRDVAGDLDDSPDNLRAVNRDCHRRITMRQIAEAGAVGTMAPVWMPITQKPLTVVVGPPSAGKSTWVKAAAKASDLVIDLDILAPTVIGKPMWIADSRERSLVIRERNSLVAEYMRGKTAHPHCFLIDTAGSFKRRKFWLDRGADVVLLDTDKDICRARIRQCSARPESTRAGRLAAVDRWE